MELPDRPAAFRAPEFARVIGGNHTRAILRFVKDHRGILKVQADQRSSEKRRTQKRGATPPVVRTVWPRSVNDHDKPHPDRRRVESEKM